MSVFLKVFIQQPEECTASGPKHVAVLQQMNSCVAHSAYVITNIGNMTQRMANIKLINISNYVEFKVSLSCSKDHCLGTIVSQINPVHIIISYFSIRLTLYLGLPNGFLCLGFRANIMYDLTSPPCMPTGPVYLNPGVKREAVT
jgi:hypothetical protein